MVSLENEYFTWKQMRENAERDIAKMENLDVENMTQKQLEARNRVIKGAKEEIKEYGNMNKINIQVSRNTHRELKELGKKGQSYDDIVKMLLEFKKKHNE